MQQLLVMATPLLSPKHVVHLLYSHWLVLIIIVIFLAALAKLSAMRTRDKPMRQAKHAANKQYGEASKTCANIDYYLEQRLQAEPNSNVLPYLRQQYQRLKAELDNHSQIDIDPSQLTSYYLQNYNDTQSQLYGEMKRLEEIVYRQN